MEFKQIILLFNDKSGVVELTNINALAQITSPKSMRNLIISRICFNICSHDENLFSTCWYIVDSQFPSCKPEYSIDG